MSSNPLRSSSRHYHGLARRSTSSKNIADYIVSAFATKPSTSDRVVPGGVSVVCQTSGWSFIHCDLKRSILGVSEW